MSSRLNGDYKTILLMVLHSTWVFIDVAVFSCNILWLRGFKKVYDETSRNISSDQTNFSQPQSALRVLFILCSI